MSQSANMSAWLATIRVPSADHATQRPAYFCSSDKGIILRLILKRLPSIQVSTLPLVLMESPPQLKPAPSYHDFRKCSSKLIHIRLRAKRPRTDTHRAIGKCANCTVNVRRAMQPRPDGNLKRLV